MDSSHSFGTMGSTYSYVVAEKMTPKLRLKKILFIVLYVVWCGGLLIGGTSLQLVAPLLAFIPISLWILIWLTWRFTQVSYEYTFESGTLTVKRMLGERTKRTIAELTIREAQSIYLDANDSRAQIDTFAADNTIFAVSAADADRMTAVLWVDQNHKKNVLFFEADEKAFKILRYYNSSAI